MGSIKRSIENILKRFIAGVYSVPYISKINDLDKINKKTAEKKDIRNVKFLVLPNPFLSLSPFNLLKMGNAAIEANAKIDQAEPAKFSATL